MNDCLGSYPYGAENDRNAPYNDIGNEEREIDVEVTLVMRKTFTVKVEDYMLKERGVDEDGHYFEDIDYSTCNLVEAVKEQVILPYNANNYVSTNTNHGRRAFKDLKDWEIDDINVEKV